MTTITAKIQIFVPDHQVEHLKVTMDIYRKACNWLSNHVFETKNLNQVKLNHLYYYDLRQHFGLKSQMAQSVIKTVIARYKSAKTNKHDWSLITFKQPEYDLVWNRDYSLTQHQFSVNTLDGRIKLNYERKGMRKYFNGTWKFGTAKLVHTLDRWFLHIPMTKEFVALENENVNNVVGS